MNKIVKFHLDGGIILKAELKDISLIIYPGTPQVSLARICDTFWTGFHHLQIGGEVRFSSHDITSISTRSSLDETDEEWIACTKEQLFTADLPRIPYDQATQLLRLP